MCGFVEDTKVEEILRSVGIDTCDTVVVATGESLESSVLAVMHCESLGVPTVVVKVGQEGLGKKSVLMLLAHLNMKWLNFSYKIFYFIIELMSFN